MITLPGANRKWSTDQSSDIYSDAIQTKNVEFDKAGYLALAKRAMVLYSKDSDSDFSNVIAMGADSTFLYVVTTNNFFLISIASETLLTVKNNTGTPPTFAFNSDLEFFNGIPHVSGTTTVNSFDPSLIGFSPWVSRITGLSSSYPHPMCKHEGRQTLLIADGNVLHQYDTSYVEDMANKLTIPADYVITGVRYRNNNAYVFTRNILGGNAKLFVWNGTGVGNNGAFGVAADWIYSGCEYGSYIGIVTSAGQVLEFNGAGFTELANFPVYYSPFPWTSANAISNLIGNVANRGMEAIGNILYININGLLNAGQASIAGTYLPGMPSGLWKYDPDIGLYHNAGLNYKLHQQLQPTGTASNALVFSTPHGLSTGDAILCVAQAGVTNARVGQTYFGIVVGPNAIQLALTPAEAVANKPIFISGTPTSGDQYAFDTYNSMGSGQVSNAGPIFIMKKLISDLFYSSTILFAGVALDNSQSSKGVLCGLGLGRNIGYFVTPKIPSANVMDIFQKLLLKYPQLNQDTEEMILKWRNNERYGTPSHTSFITLGGTFTSATTFTVNPQNKDIQTAEIGDEIEIINGAACGYLAHITNIDSITNPALWVITIDQAFPVTNGDTMDFLFVNWIQYNPMTNGEKTNTQNFAERAIGESGTWLQFKIVMAGRDIAIEQLIFINTPKKQAS